MWFRNYVPFAANWTLRTVHFLLDTYLFRMERYATASLPLSPAVYLASFLSTSNQNFLHNLCERTILRNVIEHENRAKCLAHVSTSSIRRSTQNFDVRKQQPICIRYKPLVDWRGSPAAVLPAAHYVNRHYDFWTCIFVTGARSTHFYTTFQGLF